MNTQKIARADKIKLLKNIQAGRTTVKDSFLEPITGVVFSHNDKVFAYQTIDGTKSIEPEIDFKEFEKQYGKNYSHWVRFKNFRDSTENNNKKQ